MEYHIDIRINDKWHNHGTIHGSNAANIEAHLDMLRRCFGADNVFYRPAMDGVDYILTDEATGEPINPELHQ